MAHVNLEREVRLHQAKRAAVVLRQLHLSRGPAVANEDVALQSLVVDLLHGAGHLPVRRRVGAVRPEDVDSRSALEVVGTATRPQGEGEGRRWLPRAGAQGWRAHKECPLLAPESLMSGRSLLMGYAQSSAPPCATRARWLAGSAQVQVCRRGGRDGGRVAFFSRCQKARELMLGRLLHVVACTTVPFFFLYIAKLNTL